MEFCCQRVQARATGPEVRPAAKPPAGEAWADGSEDPRLSADASRAFRSIRPRLAAAPRLAERFVFFVAFVMSNGHGSWSSSP